MSPSKIGRCVNTLFIGSLALSTPGWAQRETSGGHVVMFGNLHAHSNLSGDTKNVKVAERRKMTPAFGFERASKAGLDFLAISDHHKAPDSPGPFALTPAEYAQLVTTADAFTTQQGGAFIAIPAIEWGNTASGNHVNIFGSLELPPASILDRDYDKLYDWARANARFVQFNHPASWRGQKKRDKSIGNFGEALYASPEEFALRAGAPVATCALLNSVVGGHISGDDKYSQSKVHRDISADHMDEWLRLLNFGFRLAPSADQDTHWLNFGAVTAARTAAWVKAETFDGLMEAFTARRVYATEDDELVVSFRAAIQGTQTWMGGSTAVPAPATVVELRFEIWQAAGVDRDPRDEGPYEVEVYVDGDGTRGQRASKFGPTITVDSRMPGSVQIRVDPGAYAFLVVRETNGQDNLQGEGDDEANNESGDHGSDGKRDDPNDRAITAPVWFEPAT